MSDAYPYLEPNHSTRMDSDGLVYVRCPYIDAETCWGASAEPEEVDCEFCRTLNSMAGKTDSTRWDSHDCEDGE